LKAVQGDLFMLEKYIFFVSKQPTLIELSDVHSVVFARVGASVAAGRTFDLRIVTRSGPEFLFTSINKEERDVIETHLKDRGVKVKNEMLAEAEILAAAVGSDSDEDMASIASDDSRPRKSTRGGDADEDSEEDGELHCPYLLPRSCSLRIYAFYRGFPS
jgi:structure-specific recognition protein 1